MSILLKSKKKLVWSKSGNKITVNNPTPYFMNFQSISFNGTKSNDVSYAAPFSNATFEINNSNTNGTIKWEVINDYGAAPEALETKI